MNTINPDPARLPGILANLPENKPVVMLNLLRFRDVAQYPDSEYPGSESPGSESPGSESPGSESPGSKYPDSKEQSVSGRDAYQRYSRQAIRFVQQVGGQARYLGQIAGNLIAPEDEQWDEIMLIEYPNREAFISMLQNPEYQAITRHRTAALLDSRLIATTPFPG